MNQANGLNLDGSIPKFSSEVARLSHVDGVNLDNKDDGKPEELLHSQRKLFRVKKWKQKDKGKEDFQKKKWREQEMNKVEDHDFIVLTDSETFKKEDIEIIEGVHHLTKEGNAPYSHMTKVELQLTSEEK